MSNYNYVNRVLIGDGTQSGAVTSLPGIQKGDLLLLKEDGTVITTNAAAAALPKFEKVTIAAGVGAGLAILSSPIQGNTVSKYEGQLYVAPQEQIAYVGFNGTTGSLEATLNVEYRLRIHLKDSHRVQGQRPTLADFPAYVNTGGQKEAAAQIACYYSQKDYGTNFLGDKVQLERVSNGTFAALTNNATVVKGSKTVTSTAHGRAVGDVVRIGGTGATVPVYVIESVESANAFTLDVPYVGASATVLAANIGAITTPTSWGFKLTGIAQDGKISVNGLPIDEYEWVIFDASYARTSESTPYAAAIYTLAQQVNPGQGYWKQVNDREEAAKGYLGDTSKRRYFDQRIVSNVVIDQAYDSVVIAHADIQKGDFQGQYVAPLQTEIYIPNGSDQSDPSGDNFKDILNGYFSDVLGFTALT